MALSAARNTPERAHPLRQRVEYGMNASTTIYQGGIVCLSTADGCAVPGSTATTLRAVGRAAETKTNSGADNATTIRIDQGVFRFANSSAADLIAADDIGKKCYVVDDETVALTDGSASRSVAGTIVDVDSVGVWVLIALGTTGV